MLSTEEIQKYYSILIILVVILLVLWIPLSYVTGLIHGFAVCKGKGKNQEHYFVKSKERFRSSNPPSMNCCSNAINRFNINTMPFKKPIGNCNLFSTYLTDMYKAPNVFEGKEINTDDTAVKEIENSSNVALPIVTLDNAIKMTEISVV